MTSPPAFIAQTSTIDEAAAAFAGSDLRCGLVGSADHLVGLVVREAVERRRAAGQGTASVRGVLVDEWPFVYPDHPLDLTLERLRQGPGILPVLSRTGGRRVEGVVTHETMLVLLGEHPSMARAVEDGRDEKAQSATPEVTS
jgi:CBS domain-containing protein